MDHLKYYLTAVILSLTGLIYCGCNQQKEFVTINENQLSKLQFPDAEKNAIRKNRVTRIYLFDSNGHKLGYSEYDSTGRLKCKGGSGFMSSTTCYFYGDYFWPIQEIERSDTKITINNNHLFFPKSRFLFLLKYNTQNNLIGITRYQFDASWKLQTSLSLDRTRNDSVITNYFFEGDLLKHETNYVFARKNSIADEEIKEGLLATESSKDYFYDQNMLDSCVQNFKYRPADKFRQENIIYNEEGLREKLLLKTSKGRLPYVLTYAIGKAAI